MAYHTLSVALTPWFVSVTQAETRAEFAERSVAKLEKTIDDLEGRIFSPSSLESYFVCVERVIVSVMVSWQKKKSLKPLVCFALTLYFCFRLNGVTALFQTPSCLCVVTLSLLVVCFLRPMVGKTGFMFITDIRLEC